MAWGFGPVGGNDTANNDIIGNSYIGNYGQTAGGAPANFQDYYNQIVQQNQFNQQQQQQDDGTRELSIFDYMAKQARNASEAIRNIGGSQEAFERAQGVNKLLPFIGTLPTGILGAPGEAIASGYEAASGHNLDTANLQAGTISNKDLTPIQRMGAGMNAAIEGPMTLIGGSGRAVGAAANVLGKANPSIGRALDKVMPAEGMGVFNRIAREAGDSKPVAFGKQLGFDIVEEGSEEFVQSFAEDMRDGNDISLGKALESFGWGALGGGIMSAGGQGISLLANRSGNQVATNNQSQQTSPSQQASNQMAQDANSNPPKADAPVDDTYTPYARETRNDRIFQEGREQAGAMGATVVTGIRGQRVNDTIMGTQNFKDAWNAQGEEAHEFWSKALGKDANWIADNIVNNPNMNQATQILNDLWKRYNGSFDIKFKVTKKRDPGTSKSHLTKLNLTGFHAGSGLQLSTLASQTGNGDIDGDTSYLIDYSDDQGALYPTQLLSNPDGNPTSLLEYMPNMDSKKGKEAIKKLGDTAFKAVFSSEPTLSDSLVEHLSKARKSEDSAKMAATLLTRIRRDMLTSKNPVTNRMYTADEVDEIMSDFLSDVIETAGQVEQISEIVEESVAAVKKILNPDSLSTDDDSGEYKIVDGDVSGLRSVADLMARVGYNISLSRVTKDEPLRDEQGIKYKISKHRDSVNGTLRSFGNYSPDVIHRLFASILRLEGVGENVQNTIKDYIALECVSNFIDNLNVIADENNRLGANITLEEFQKAWETAYNDVINSYNKAINKDNINGEAIELFDLIQMNEISFSKNYEHACNSMYKMLKDEQIDTYVFISKDSPLAGMTFYEASLYQYENNISEEVFVNMGDGRATKQDRDFMSSVLDARQSESLVVSNRLHKQLSSEKTPRMTIKDAKDPLGYQKSSLIMSSVTRGLAPEVMEYHRLMDWREIIESKHAKVILNGDADERCAFLIRLSLEYKYRNVLALIEESKKKDSKVTPNHIAHAAAMLRDGSRLADTIADEFANEGESKLLNELLNEKTTYGSMIHVFASKCRISKKNAGSLLADAIRTDSSDMGLSVISQRIVRMQQESKHAKNMSNDKWLSYVNDFIDEVEKEVPDNNGIMDDVTDWITDESTGQNIMFFQSFFNGCRTISLQHAEKGISTANAVAMSMVLEQRSKGGIYSYLDNVMAHNMGVMRQENFITNRLALIDVLFHGKTIKVERANEYAFVDAQKVCDDLLGEGAVKVENGRLSWDQFKRVLQAAPTLLSTIMPEIATMPASSSQTPVFAHKGNPDKSFASFRNRKNNHTEDHQKDHDRNMLKWELSMDISFYASLPGIMNLSDSSVTNLNDQVNDAIESYISNITHDAKRMREAAKSNTEEAKNRYIEIARARSRAAMFASQAKNAGKDLEEAGAIADYASGNSPVNTIEMVSTITDPLNVINIILDDEAKKLLSDSIESIPGLSDEQKVILYDYFTKLGEEHLDEVYSKLVNGKKDAAQISLDLVSMIGSEAYKAIILEEISGPLLGININDNDTLSAALRSVAETVSNSLYNTVSGSGVLAKDTSNIFDFECYDREKLIAHPSEMKRKAKAILEGVAYDPDNKALKNIEKEIDEYSAIINDDSQSLDARREAIDALEETRIYIVNASLKHGLGDIGKDGIRPLNYNAYYDTNNFYEDYWDMVERVAFETNDDGRYKYHLSNYVDDQEVPKMNINFSSPENSFMSMNAAYSIVTGRIGYGVAANGSLLNTSIGLAALPHTIECGDPGRKVKVADILIQNLDNSNLNIEIEIDGEPQRKVLNSSFDISKYDPDLEITVFDGVCRNPFCSKHSKTIGYPGFEDNIDVLEMYAELLDVSQEDANLKLKKSMRKLKKLATKRLSDPAVNIKKFKPEASWSPEEISMKTVESILDFRSDLEEYSKTAFDIDLGDGFISISDDQAANMAKVGAHLAEFVYIDNDGNTVTRIVHLDDLMNGDKYVLPGSIDYSEIISIAPFYTTFETLNQKAIHDVAEDRFNPDPSTKRNIDTKIMRSTLERSTKDWSQYGAGTLNIGNALKAAPAKGLAHPSQFVPIDSPSAKQRILRDLGKDTNTPISSIVNNSVENLPYETHKNIVHETSKLLGYEDGKLAITKVRFGKQTPTTDVRFRKIHDYKKNTLNLKDVPSDFGVSGSQSAYMFVGTQDEVNNLIKDVDGNQYLYNWILVNHKPPRGTAVGFQKVIDGTTFYAVNTNATLKRGWAGNNTFAYPLRARSIEDYVAVYFDDSDHGFLAYGDSAGQATKEVMEMYLKKVKDTPFTINMKWDRYIHNPDKAEVLNVNDYKSILDSINNNDGKVELHTNGYEGKVHESVVRDNAIKFLEQASSNKRIMDDSDMWKAGAIQKDQVFGFVVRKELSTIHVYPLIFTGNTTRTVSNVSDISVQGNTITVQKESLVEIGPDDSVKGFIDWEAYKGMIAMLDQDRSAIAPTLGGFDDSFRKYIYYDGKAREGRMSTRGKMTFIMNCWGQSRIRNSSLRAGLNSNKELSEWARSNNNQEGKRNIDRLFDDAGINNSDWKLIADGQEVLFAPTKENRLLNNAIKTLAHNSVYGSGIPLSILFESHPYNVTTKEWGDFKPRDCDEIGGLLNILSFNEIKAIFNAMNPLICTDPNDFSASREDPGTYVRDDGFLLWDFPGDKPSYAPGRILVPNFTDDATTVGQGLGGAVFGSQTVNKIALRHGMRAQDEQNFLDAIISQAGGYVNFDKSDLDKSIQEVSKNIDLHPNAIKNFNIDSVNGPWGNLAIRKSKLDSIEAVSDNWNEIGMKIVRRSGNKVETINLASDEEYQNYKESMRQALDIDYYSDLMFINHIKMATCWSTQNGSGEQEVDIKHVKEAVDMMTARIDKSDYFIEGGPIGSENDRVSLPLGPRAIMLETYNNSRTFKKQFATFEDFMAAAKKELKNTITATHKLKYFDGNGIGQKQEKKKQAIINMITYSQMTNGLPIDTNQIFAGGFQVTDLLDMDDHVLRALLTKDEYKSIEIIRDQVKASEEKWKRMHETAVDKKQIRLDNKAAQSGWSALVKNSDATMTTKILGRVEHGIRLCAVSNPLLFVPNTLEAAGHTLIAKVGMGMPIGPYSQKSLLPKGFASEVAKDQRAFKLFKIITTAQLLNLNQELIEGINDADGDLDAFIDNVYGGRSRLSKFSDFVFRFTSGSDITMRMQFELFIERMGQMVVHNGIESETFEIKGKDENGDDYSYSAMQMNLMNDPSGWLVSLMMADNPAHSTFLNCLNFSQGAAMARDTCVSIFMDELFKKHPAASFFNTCFGSTFYRYTSNFTGRILNWVMPISSMNYLLVEKLSGDPNLEHFGFDRAQIHADLKSAVIADAMHLSIPALAILLATCLGAALQPPEDEDKANDYREYTFFGFRIAEEWWMSDILGPALPMACFMKSMIDNKPRPDVLIEGMGTVLANNPLMKVGDLVEIVTNPDALLDDLDDEKDKYESAFGGAPTDMEQWLAKTGQYFLTCFGRMITPSIIREWQNNTLKYEKSYKRIYADGVTGVDSEEGVIADTKRTTYEDAMLRQVTRNNPMLGFICDVMFHPNTSYVAGGSLIQRQGMPNVTIDDVYQRYISKQYTIYEVDESGNYVKDKDGKYVEKSQDQKDKIAFDVIATLESTDNMQELHQKGFMIDAATRAYVSDVIWSIVKTKQEYFNEIANSKEYSAYALGGGDYWTGREIRSEMFQAYYDDINYLKDLYKNKLWSYEMKQGVQQYIRENVTYRQDSNGEWYATGNYKTDLNPLGVSFAHGTTKGPFTAAQKEGTLGWEGDWATPSAVTGESLFDRSLIAIKADSEETPDFETWGEKRGLVDSDGNLSTTSSTTNNSDKPTVTNNPYDISAMNGGGGGGGGIRRSGGGGGRSGGGGGSSSPNLYSRLPNLNVNTPKTANSSRLYDTNFDYLRPSFETKGSREANKRGDI